LENHVLYFVKINCFVKGYVGNDFVCSLTKMRGLPKIWSNLSQKNNRSIIDSIGNIQI
jgi:hypothetical protein